MQWPNDAHSMAESIIDGDQALWSQQVILANGIETQARLQIHTRHMWHSLTQALQTDFPSVAEYVDSLAIFQSFIADHSISSLNNAPAEFVGWLSSRRDNDLPLLERARFDLAMQKALHRPDHQPNSAPPSDWREMTVSCELASFVCSPLNAWASEPAFIAFVREQDQIAQYSLSQAEFELLTNMQHMPLLEALAQLLDVQPDFDVPTKLTSYFSAGIISSQSPASQNTNND